MDKEQIQKETLFYLDPEVFGNKMIVRVDYRLLEWGEDNQAGLPPKEKVRVKLISEKHSKFLSENNPYIVFPKEGVEMKEISHNHYKLVPGESIAYHFVAPDIAKYVVIIEPRKDEGRIIPEADTENFLAVSSNILMIKWEQVEGSEVYVCIFSQYPDGTQIREYKR